MVWSSCSLSNYLLKHSLTLSKLTHSLTPPNLWILFRVTGALKMNPNDISFSGPFSSVIWTPVVNSNFIIQYIKCQNKSWSDQIKFKCISHVYKFTLLLIPGLQASYNIAAVAKRHCNYQEHLTMTLPWKMIIVSWRHSITVDIR